MTEPDSSERDEARLAAALVSRIAAGDRAAEGDLVERYSRGLLYLLRRLSGDPGQAEDLHQETFRIVLERLRERPLEEPEKLAGFLHRTARYVYLGERRKTVRRRTEPDPETLSRTADARPSQLSQAQAAEEARTVRRLIAELGTERDRQILYRFYVAEERKEAICDALELDSLHFNRVLFRAKQRFRSLFERRAQRPWPKEVSG